VSVIVAPAFASELTEIEDIVRGVGLPLEGLRSQFPTAFVIARHGGAIVGVAALERYGRAGLLRSVAVLPARHGLGVGKRLVTNRLEHARDAGLERVFLLTTTAPGYFLRFGFTPAERGQVPAGMAKSPEFTGACPTSAACLVWSPGE